MRSLRLARVRGIDVRVHPSWVVVGLLVTASLGALYFPVALPDAAPTFHLLLGALASLVLLASVLVHELAHSLVARRYGVEVRSITLFLFGGVSDLAGEPPDPRAELVIAAAGPLTSLGAAAALLAALVASASHPEVGALLEYAMVVNALLGLFNLVPGFPLDGGRVLRAAAWGLTGSLRRATEVAGAVGLLVAGLVVVWGIARVVDRDVVGGGWVVLLGSFLARTAVTSVAHARLETTLHALRVGDIVRPDARAVPPDLDLARLAQGHLIPLFRHAVPVAVDGRVVGLVSLADVRDVPAHARATTRVADVIAGRGAPLLIRPTDTLAAALDELWRGDREHAPVVDGERLVGVVSRGDILRLSRLRTRPDD